VSVPAWEKIKRLFAEQRAQLDFEKEATLDADIYPSQQIAPHSKQTNVLLTGATGFLGSAMLYELMEQTESHVWCLVRCKNIESGMQRIQEASTKRLLWKPTFAERIHVVPGDLSLPRLGLSEEEFIGLGQRTGVIYHVGARINIIFPYSLLAPTNVLGTKEILRLATIGQTSPVHYVSTAAILMTGQPNPDQVLEDRPLPDPPGHAFGYIHTKWVAEKLLAEARTRGMPIVIYRPTIIGWHSETGIANPTDFVCIFLRACLSERLAPELDIVLDIVPLDYVARTLIHIAQQPAALGKCFHLSNPHPTHWRRLLDICNSLGYEMELRPYRSWYDGVQAAPRRIAHRMGLALSDPNDPSYMSLFDLLAEQAVPRIHCDNTNALSSASLLSIPDMDEKLVEKLLMRLAA
jgi:thioester reductase-like protein